MSDLKPGDRIKSQGAVGKVLRVVDRKLIDSRGYVTVKREYYIEWLPSAHLC